MFFFGPKVLLLLKRHSLEIYYKNSDKVMEIPFHSSAVRHLEVVSRDEVVKTLVEAFKSASLGRQTAVIALSDQIVFERLISQKNSQDPQKELARFYADVPLDETHIAKKIIPLKGAVLALSANRQLYQLVVEVAHEFEWKIKAVIPMTPFAKVAEDIQLTPEQVSQILKADDIFKEDNFLSESVLAVEIPSKKVKQEENEKEEGESGDEERRSRSSPIVASVIALFLLSLIAGSLLYYKIIALPFNLPWISPIPVASSVPEATESAQTAPVESSASANTQEASVSAEFNRSEIRIHVLNGSGISAQAAVVKEKLAEIGYENVITGNIEASEASGSSIIYSENLEESVKDEINKLMDSLVEGITKTEEAINEFNAVITLGKLEEPIQ